MFFVAVLPAYAGMIHPPSRRRRKASRAPRVCGDDPNARIAEEVMESCSPRMRG